LVGEISWAKHLVIMSRCKDDLEREFYIRMTQRMGWTKNVLIHCRGAIQDNLHLAEEIAKRTPRA